MDLNKIVKDHDYVVLISDGGKDLGHFEWEGCHVDHLRICQNLCGMRYKAYRPQLILIDQDSMMRYNRRSELSSERFIKWFMSDVMPLTANADIMIGNFKKEAESENS